MQIKIDSREKDRVALATAYYQSKNEVNKKPRYMVEKKTLPTADYVFEQAGETVAFEYKEIADFMTSTKDGSLFEELMNQTKDYDFNYLIIVGSLNKLLDTTYSESYNVRSYYKSKKNYNIKSNNIYKGAVRRCLTILPVIKVRDETTAFNEMFEIASKCFSTKIIGGTKRPVKTGDIISHMLVGASGVSEKKAVLIMNSLAIKSPEDLLSKSSEDFATVKSIGKKTAEDIYKWLHKEE